MGWRSAVHGRAPPGVRWRVARRDQRGSAPVIPVSHVALRCSRWSAYGHVLLRRSSALVTCDRSGRTSEEKPTGVPAPSRPVSSARLVCGNYGEGHRRPRAARHERKESIKGLHNLSYFSKTEWFEFVIGRDRRSAVTADNSNPGQRRGPPAVEGRGLRSTRPEAHAAIRRPGGAVPIRAIDQHFLAALRGLAMTATPAARAAFAATGFAVRGAVHETDDRASRRRRTRAGRRFGASIPPRARHAAPAGPGLVVSPPPPPTAPASPTIRPRTMDDPASSQAKAAPTFKNSHRAKRCASSRADGGGVRKAPT